MPPLDPSSASFAAPRSTSCNVLLIDDEPTVLASYARIIRASGCPVRTATGVTDAIDALRDGGIDVVITDMRMPDGTGLDVLDAVRADRPGTPVIFLTGSTELEAAVQALERGAVRYLMKPARPDDLVRAVESACRVAALLARGEIHTPVGRDLANLDVRFDAALEGLSLVCQPICRWSSRRIEAFEVLVRTKEASLRRPDRLIAAAEKLGRMHELGRAVRRRAAGFAATMTSDVDLHVNLHPFDLTDLELYEKASPLALVARRVVLELTERAALERIDAGADRVAALRRLGYRIALDDLGGGYASLNSVAALRPDSVKLDLALVQGVAAEPTRRTVIEVLREVCERTGIELVCEGVESEADLAALIEIGCDVFQGHLFARPSVAPSAVAWNHTTAERSVARGSSPPFGDLGRTQELGGVAEIAAMLARDARDRLEGIRAGSSGAMADQADEAITTLAALVELVERGPQR
jgi:EAL domain-containing protein (putative c-di-GMP-specific phosphodiesterase class I)